jgi:hypothetical protein
LEGLLLQSAIPVPFFRPAIMCNQWFSVAAEVFKSTSLTLHKQQQSRLALQIQKAWFGCAILRIG